MFRSMPSLRSPLGWLTLPSQVLGRRVTQASAKPARGGAAQARAAEPKELAGLQKQSWEWRHGRMPWLRPLHASLGNADARSQRIRCVCSQLADSFCSRLETRRLRACLLKCGVQLPHARRLSSPLYVASAGASL